MSILLDGISMESVKAAQSGMWQVLIEREKRDPRLNTRPTCTHFLRALFDDAIWNQSVQNMSFSEKQQAAIEAHLKEFSLDTCPICNESSWEIHSDLGALCAQHGSGVNLYKTLQLVSNVCGNCGYVVHIDAEKVGVDMDITLKTNK